ncbi:hypothetical protein [Clostridium felsineum]|uniref:hypothetical protein n=1 Tax=Clostridium felsineum TaxID=36839 RepID=UPI00098CA97B|nr:hypothetical protein [Clostridium felsineum]URZ17744.1 hypothetical protein CLFE_037990 [Clostridium felsineum DSM 794]
MRNKIFRKLVEFYDIDNVGKGTLVGVSIMSYLMAKRTGHDGKFWVCLVITFIIILGLIVQILREDRDVKKIKTCLVVTLLGAFVTSIIYLGNKYYNNDAVSDRLVELLLWVLVIVAIIRAMYMIRDKSNKMKKSKKIIVVIAVIYFVAATMAATIFFEFKIGYFF